MNVSPLLAQAGQRLLQKVHYPVQLMQGKLHAFTQALGPEKVSPGLVVLAGEDAPTRMILLAGAGSFECAHVTMTRGVHLSGDDVALQLRERLGEVQDRYVEVVPASGWEQYRLELAKAGLLETAGGVS
jgi:hypothetical protein